MKTPNKYLIISILMLFIILSGCLETPVAAPPKIDDSMLEEYGWVQLGDSTSSSKSFEISGREIQINTASITYADKGLEEDMMTQIAAYITLPQNGFTAQITAMRIVLPSGIPLPSQLVLEMASKQVEEMAREMEIKDFHKTNTTTIELKDGETAEAKVYAGQIAIDGNAVPIKGILTTWSTSGSTIIASAIYPSDDFVLEIEDEKVIINIDGEAEYEEIIELLQHME